MALKNARNAIRNPGSLCYAPTDLTTAFPHGGIALGLARQAEFKLGSGYLPIEDESFGGHQPIEVVSMGEAPILACVLRGMDNDAVSALFMNASTGTVTQNKKVTYKPGVSGQNRPGYLLSGKAVKLCFSPDNLDNGEMVLIYAAVPALDLQTTLQLNIGHELGVAAVFIGIPDSTGRIYEIGNRKDLAL